MSKYNITEIKEKEASYRSAISPELMDELETKIDEIIIVKKKFRDKDFSAVELAKLLGTNARYISAVTNLRFHLNYTSYVNQYRIREAMSILVDKRYRNLKMEDVADMVGFSNRQSFYAAFFKIVGITPREYKLQQIQFHPAIAVEPKKRGRKPLKKTGLKAKAKV